ncbi:MAG: hypothetical protein H0A75_08415 [Candidatus Methanofishera endochildressiae]|uniref:Uncharacterized protein n=1 Tax=Candidatus Methanofishera endochildressiae TaxID=2738884 RepID=A0A7Z0MPM0_9GAMM|nr:hypothetical protein [Candidatus Methanofishera endochildressiae]
MCAIYPVVQYFYLCWWTNSSQCVIYPVVSISTSATIGLIVLRMCLSVVSISTSAGGLVLGCHLPSSQYFYLCWWTNSSRSVSSTQWWYFYLCWWTNSSRVCHLWSIFLPLLVD